MLIKIYLAQGDKPIIIDSHDDHPITSSSWMSRCRQLGKAKQYRQVTIVSNNGNMAGNSDEQVIIASRDQQDKFHMYLITRKSRSPQQAPGDLEVVWRHSASAREKYRLHPYFTAMEINTPTKKTERSWTKYQKWQGYCTKNYRDRGNFPIVDQGQSLIAGYTDDSSTLYQVELPVVIFGDHTREIKFVDFPFAVGAIGRRKF